MTRVVLCCGAGGVGKTTTAAALALRFALDGHHVVVLTIDPARRLADSIGIPLVGNTATEVDLEDLDAQGTLHALMLDVSSTFDHLVDGLLQDPAAFARIRQNPYYRFFSSRLSGSHEFMAMERLYSLAEDDRFDVVVVDTPPSVHAIDFLTASERLIGVLDQRVLRTLALPKSRSGLKLLQQGSEAVSHILERMVGVTTITEIAEFIASLEGITGAIAKRAEAARALLRSDGAAFLVVTTASPSALEESGELVDALHRNRFPFRGFVWNRAMPKPPPCPQTTDLEMDTPGLTRLFEDATRLHDQMATTEMDRFRQFQGRQPPSTRVWTVPALGEEAHEIEVLVRISEILPTLEELYQAIS